MIALWRRLVEWWRAVRRGEIRNASSGLRGRVYKKREGWFYRIIVRPFLVGFRGEGGSALPIKSEPVGTISARVYRAKTGEWEDLGVISSGRLADGKIQKEN